MDQTVVLMHHLTFKLGRIRLEFSLQTQASVDRLRRIDAYLALRKQAVALWSPHAVEWFLEDRGGSLEENAELLRQIIDGTLSNPWPDDPEGA